ncbi:MAG TPA: hypothetical protein VMJ65_09610 [Solirubrobacteraceae bacterium]|nr:hypothetical protein [Solirubrobacteraceae bacterium]
MTAVAERPETPRSLSGIRNLSSWLHGWRLLAVCVVISLVSVVVLPSVPSYDPYAWITWGRELFNGLDTNGGPSWKPFPVIFTGPFALFGGGAPYLWIAVSRVGGLLSFVGAYRLAARLSGRLAGWGAVAALALTLNYATYGLRGTSEPLLVCFALWTIVFYLDGRRLAAYWSAVALSLIRPEAWLFIAVYAIVLWVREPRWRWQIAAGIALIGFGWFVPPWISVGDPFGASTHAASFNGHLGGSPAWTVLQRGAQLTVFPVLVGALVAIAFAIRRRDWLPLILAGLALAWVAIVVISTLAAYPGLARFMLPAEAIACVLFGVGVSDLASLVPDRRIAAVGVLGLALLTVWLSHSRISSIHQEAATARLAVSTFDSMSLAIERAGGRDALVPCPQSRLAVNHTAATALAWKLDLPLSRVKSYLAHPGVIFRGVYVSPLGAPPDLSFEPRTIHTIARVGHTWHVMAITPPGGTPGHGCVGS